MKGSTRGHTIISAYMHSPGHKKTLLSNQNEYGIYCSFISAGPKFETTILHSPEIIISMNYDKLATEKERQNQDKNAKVISKGYKYILDNAYKNIQSTANQGFDWGGYLEFTFTKSDLSKCKTLYPWATDEFLNQYFNNTTYSYYESRTSYYYDDNGKERTQTYTTVKPEYQNKVNELYIQFVKEYAKFIPYQQTK